MDYYEENRRAFLRKLGLTLGATITSSAVLSANIVNKHDSINILPEQQLFMNMYEDWMDQFIEVIKKQKQDPDNFENNKQIVVLSEQAKKWQSQLAGYMEDENFARYYMIATQRMTMEI